MSFYKQVYKYGILFPIIFFNIIAISIALIFYRNYANQQDNDFKDFIFASLEEDLRVKLKESALQAEILAESKSLYDLINAEVLERRSLEKLATQFSQKYNSHVEIYRNNTPLVRIEESVVPISNIGAVIRVFSASRETSRQYFMYENDLLYFNSLRRVPTIHGDTILSISSSLESKDFYKYSEILKTKVALHRKETRRMGNFIESDAGLKLFVGLSDEGEKINLTYDTSEHLWMVNKSFDSFQNALILTLLPFSFITLIFSFTYLKAKYNEYSRRDTEKSSLLKRFNTYLNDSAKKQSDICVATSTNSDKLSSILKNLTSHKQLLNRNIEEINTFSKQLQGTFEKLEHVEDQFDEVVENLNNILIQLEESASAASHVKSVASETTILSLNAALEASQAGEKGKGFATVAVNVKKLAAQTTELAENIKDKIEFAQLSSEKCTSATKGNVKAFKSIVSSMENMKEESRKLNSLFQARARENSKNLEKLEIYQEQVFHLMESAQKLDQQSQQMLTQTPKEAVLQKVVS